jgi:uncharacterized protein (TIGR02145 family)
MKKQKTAITLLLLVAIYTIISCSNATNDIASVKIGTQTWTAKNLDVSTFRNGDPIPEVKSDEEWVKAGNEKKSAWCYFKNDPANGVVYGKLYNWYAVNDPRGLAPEGWHVPSDAEWTSLTTFLGGEDVASGKLKEIGTTNWVTPNAGATNETGFTALPGDNRSGNGSFSMLGYTGYWWSSTMQSAGIAYFRDIYYSNSVLARRYDNMNIGLSVRCVKGSGDAYVKLSVNDEIKPVEKVIVAEQSAMPVVPGIYKNGLLFLAYDGENVTGFYSHGRYEGNPNFGCSFYFFGKSSDKFEDRMIKIKVMSPFDLSTQPTDGTFKLHSEENDIFSLVAKLDGNYCWDPQLDWSAIGEDPGVSFSINEKKDWSEIRIASSEKVYFYNEKDESTIRKTYVVKGDPLIISEKDGEWVMATFKGSKSETTGWIKRADTKSLMEISAPAQK